MNRPAFAEDHQLKVRMIAMTKAKWHIVKDVLARDHVHMFLLVPP